MNNLSFGVLLSRIFDYSPNTSSSCIYGPSPNFDSYTFPQPLVSRPNTTPSGSTDGFISSPPHSLVLTSSTDTHSHFVDTSAYYTPVYGSILPSSYDSVRISNCDTPEIDMPSQSNNFFSQTWNPAVSYRKYYATSITPYSP